MAEFDNCQFANLSEILLLRRTVVKKREGEGEGLKTFTLFFSFFIVNHISCLTLVDKLNNFNLL